ncbi:MAG TPA: TIGR03936 family radical SAM-associated protein [Candidatus Limnocylindrales bacterium]|nr:TIGR03936 family radical SAM-associated protein [Candidatus Limnocylindrales bacterium]
MSELPDAAAEPRQRWRLVVARALTASHVTQREVAAAWTDALEAAGLPLVDGGTGRGRSRLSFGAPLPVGMAAERELIDIVLTEQWPAWRVREVLVPRLPDGWRLIDAFDVWLGGPPLAGRVVAADYRIELAGDPDAGALTTAARDLMNARSIPRDRIKAGSTVTYDLRPLVTSIAVRSGPPVVVLARTRFDPELGTGRPEEVVAALEDRLGWVLDTAMIVRERLLLAEDVDT